MKFNIVLDRDDFITYHLFRASQSTSVKKRRLVHWFGIPLVYFITALLLRQLKSPELVQTIFAVTGLLWIFIYPFYSKWAITRFLTRQINQKYSGLFGKTGVLDINQNHISLKNTDNSMKIDYNEITNISELSSHILIDLANGYCLIIPKSQVPENERNEAIDLISNLSKNEIVNKTDWNWK